MNPSRRRWCQSCAAALANLQLPQAGRAAARAADDVKDTLTLAYLYGFAPYEIARLRYLLQFDPGRPLHLPSNSLYHSRQLATPASREVTTPNADTLYSLALLDLRGGPIRIDVPDTAGRYYSLALIDAYTNAFAYVGRRTTGTRAGTFTVVGPQSAPGASGSSAVIAAPTSLVVVLLRILVNAPADLDAVHQLQDGFRLQPSAVAPPPQPAPIAPVPNSGENFVAVVNRVLGENPPPPADRTTLDRIAGVGVGPSAVPLGGRLRRAWNAQFATLQHALVVSSAQRGTVIDGWSYPPPDVGRFGTDYATRAEFALRGLLANVREEDLDLGAIADSSGAPLDGARAYRLRLPARMPVDAFWSLSMYAVQPDGRLYFADNALHRWTIGDRSPGLRRNSDGSLDLRIARTPPEAAFEANWLPIPAGPFHLNLRNYQPQAQLLDGRFTYAALERIES